MSKIEEAKARIDATKKRLPEWAQKVVRDTETRFFTELQAMDKRVKNYQLQQMADFVSFATRLVDEMTNEVKKEAKRNGYDYLVAMRIEKETRAKVEAALEKLDN